MDNQPQQGSGAPMSAPVKSSMSKGVLVVIAGVAVAAFVGAAAWAYTSYYAPDPEKMLEKVFAADEKTTSAEFDGEVKFEMTAKKPFPNPMALGAEEETESGPKDYTVTGAFSGALDESDRKNPRAAIKITVGGNFLQDMGLSSGIEAEYRVAGKVVYLKLTKLPSLGFIDLNPILGNQWIKIDILSFYKQYGPGDAAKELERLQNSQLTDEQKTKLRETFKKYNILEFKKMGSAKVNGVSTYRYGYTLNKNELRRALPEVAAIFGEKTIQEDQENLDELFKDLEKVGPVAGEIYVGKKDGRIYKVSGGFAIPKNENMVKDGRASFVFAFKNYNKPVTVDVPAKAKPVEELLQEIMGGFGAVMGPSQVSPKFPGN